MYYKSLITIGQPVKDPANFHRTIIDYDKGRSVIKWYKANNTSEVLSLIPKTRFAKFRYIKAITFDEYIKGVEKSHEY